MVNVEKEIKDVINFIKKLGKKGEDGKYMYVR